MKVAEWIELHPGRVASVAEGQSLEDATERLLSDDRLRGVFVVDGEDRPVGWLSAPRLLHFALGDHHEHLTRRQLWEHLDEGDSSSVMDRQIQVAHLDEDLVDVLHRLMHGKQEDLPVLDEEGRLVGVVHLRELVRKLLAGRDRDLDPGDPED